MEPSKMIKIMNTWTLSSYSLSKTVSQQSLSYSSHTSSTPPSTLDHYPHSLKLAAVPPIFKKLGILSHFQFALSVSNTGMCSLLHPSENPPQLQQPITNQYSLTTQHWISPPQSYQWPPPLLRLWTPQHPHPPWPHCSFRHHQPPPSFWPALLSPSFPHTLTTVHQY